MHRSHTEHTVQSTPGDAATLAEVAALRPAGGPWQLSGPVGEPVVLPEALVEVLTVAAAGLADGGAVTLSRHEQTVTTQEAADLLGVSRPTLVRLLDAGVLPFDQPARHRRLLLRDVLAFQASRHHDDRPA
ncbi:DNA binding domain-containing protein, excisionase family [Modestobacter sp. DSM 44400]|uniref:excisionase family DNA-binding protein n=1 Tax=Modestobacter sp. DSM 44400 TaxID=1550230 RepID=UPI000899014A|nr:helix-turn-helix domain-containing protein [Modestobacter sp. DSM 44400]SDY43155.1 DNA binding domain-containing protein, excisionase family [Modestobacter sp. DSM 44400]